MTTDQAISEGIVTLTDRLAAELTAAQQGAMAAQNNLIAGSPQTAIGSLLEIEARLHHSIVFYDAIMALHRLSGGDNEAE